MRIVLFIVFFLLVILYLGRTEITWHPFSIRMEGWMNLVGWLLIGAGVLFLGADIHRRGYQQAMDDVMSYMTIKKI